MLLRWWIFGGMAIISSAQTLTTLVSFNGTDGVEPDYGSLVQGTDGNFYGTTYSGGANNTGTVFKVTPGGTLTTLYSFTGGTDGEYPYAGLVQASDGNFYGTTYGGGCCDGTVFKITPGGTLTTLYGFTGGADGGSPSGALVQATDGNFYGTTRSGGANGGGTVFKVTPGGTLTTLYSFGAAGTDGAQPYAGVIQGTDGNFYGTTYTGHTVFKITPGGMLTTLHTFSGPDGGDPLDALVQASDGNFYGTTSSGGSESVGTIFKITPGGTLTTLHDFTDGATDGARPYAGLIQGTDGNFYGTTEGGGTSGDGTIFKITPSGVLTILHNFNGTDGFRPYAGLIEGTDGNLYGTTEGALGTVFVLQTTLPTSGPTPAITLVQNAEGGASTIAPNTWVTLKGSNLAPAGDSRIWQASDFVNNELPTQLDGVSVKLNGENAYVYYISPTQINILTPPDMAAGTVQVQAATNAGTSAPFAAQAQAESPSFFIFGAGPYVAATHGDGSLIGPTSLYSGLTTPAQPGETIVLYANGFGPTSTPVVSGSETQSGSLNPLPVVTIGVNPATVQFAGLISPGLFQFNVVVPASTPAGDNAVTATYDGLTTQSGVLVTVGP
jgi:uncharacterized protein (TIGR03437 family)